MIHWLFWYAVFPFICIVVALYCVGLFTKPNMPTGTEPWKVGVKGKLSGTGMSPFGKEIPLLGTIAAWIVRLLHKCDWVIKQPDGSKVRQSKGKNWDTSFTPTMPGTHSAEIENDCPVTRATFGTSDPYIFEVTKNG